MRLVVAISALATFGCAVTAAALRPTSVERRAANDSMPVPDLSYLFTAAFSYKADRPFHVNSSELLALAIVNGTISGPNIDGKITGGALKVDYPAGGSFPSTQDAMLYGSIGNTSFVGTINQAVSTRKVEGMTPYIVARLELSIGPNSESQEPDKYQALNDAYILCAVRASMEEESWKLYCYQTE